MELEGGKVILLSAAHNYREFYVHVKRRSFAGVIKLLGGTDVKFMKSENEYEDQIGDLVVLRDNFKRGQITHGSKSHRALGSIGAGTTPGRVYKGKKMPGRMGGTKTKIHKLPIVKIDNELRVVMIKGDLPGKPGNLLRITPAKIVGKNIPTN
ncbi:unnamed protein product [Rhodiola kirilowii]